MFAATIRQPPLVALSSTSSSQIRQSNKWYKLHRPYCFLPNFFLQENHHLQKPAFLPYCATSQGASGDGTLPQEDSQLNKQENRGFWQQWKEHSGDMKEKVAKLGVAAVLAYGFFDGVTYTSFFVLAFLGYEKSTGKNPAANLQALLGIVILMWTGNNVTRPFRVAGAAALAPVIDKGLHRIQKYFNFPNLVHAFALVVSMVAGTCFIIVGLLILSRWGK